MAKAAEKTAGEDFSEPGFVKAGEHFADMSAAPKDGRWIEVSENGIDWVRARWYETRVRAAGSVAWVKAAAWSTSEPSKLVHRIDNPKAWRPC
jgi:hypothetical protein